MVVAESGPLTLVSGPARSGKSRWAEHLASTSGLRVHYLATAATREGDPSWQRRLRRHRERRPSHWTTHDCGGDLAGPLSSHGAGDLLLIDSLGTWLVHHLELDDGDWTRQQTVLLAGLARCPAAVVLVCEETGWGVVPSTAVGGLFRDRMGELCDQLHGRASASWLVIHGRAVDLLRHSTAVPP